MTIGELYNSMDPGERRYLGQGWEAIRPDMQLPARRLTRVEIDPNVRTRDNETYARTDEADGDLNIGDLVILFESEDRIEWDGTVARFARGLVYFRVDWANVREMTT